MPSHPTSMTMASRGTSSVARAASHSSRGPAQRVYAYFNVVPSFV